jgi:hypothetical protein
MIEDFEKRKNGKELKIWAIYLEVEYDHEKKKKNENRAWSTPSQALVNLVQILVLKPHDLLLFLLRARDELIIVLFNLPFKLGLALKKRTKGKRQEKKKCTQISATKSSTQKAHFPGSITKYLSLGHEICPRPSARERGVAQRCIDLAHLQRDGVHVNWIIVIIVVKRSGREAVEIFLSFTRDLTSLTNAFLLFNSSSSMPNFFLAAGLLSARCCTAT